MAAHYIYIEELAFLDTPPPGIAVAVASPRIAAMPAHPRITAMPAHAASQWGVQISSCMRAGRLCRMSYDDSNFMVSDLFAPPTDELSEVMRVYQSDLLTNSVPMDAQARPCVHEQRGCPLHRHRAAHPCSRTPFSLALSAWACAPRTFSFLPLT